jgi:hypothetical protein
MRGKAAMAISRRWSAGRPRPATSDWTGEAPVSPSINKVHWTRADECVRPYVSMTTVSPALFPLPPPTASS